MRAPRPANDDAPELDGDLWYRCRCGSTTFQARMDRGTGHRHMICKDCSRDHTMAVFG